MHRRRRRRREQDERGVEGAEERKGDDAPRNVDPVGAVPQQDEDNDSGEADKCIWLTEEQMSASVVIGQEFSDDTMRQLLQRSKHLCAVACKSPS